MNTVMHAESQGCVQPSGRDHRLMSLPRREQDRPFAHVLDAEGNRGFVDRHLNHIPFLHPQYFQHHSHGHRSSPKHHSHVVHVERAKTQTQHLLITIPLHHHSPNRLAKITTRLAQSTIHAVHDSFVPEQQIRLFLVHNIIVHHIGGNPTWWKRSESRSHNCLV